MEPSNIAEEYKVVVINKSKVFGRSICGKSGELAKTVFVLES